MTKWWMGHIPNLFLNTLGGVMWQQMCKAEKVDAFDQILREMAIRYDPNSWRSLADV